MPPKLRAEDEDSSSDTESELGSGPSSVEILALNDRMSTALELVTEHLAAVTGGASGSASPRGSTTASPSPTSWRCGASTQERPAPRTRSASDAYVLKRIFPLALPASARRWWVLQILIDCTSTGKGYMHDAKRFGSRIKLTVKTRFPKL